MQVVMDIPNEFEMDYKTDKFREFFERVLADMADATVCGSYEREIAEMFFKQFQESKVVNSLIEVVMHEA